MARCLFILRHAKSAWDTDSASDFERPLAKRGIKDAPRIGRWMKAHDVYPEYIVSSPALRAKQTSCLVVKELSIPEKEIHWDKRVYSADVPILLKVISECPPSNHALLLVGHNPGLEDLLIFLCGEKATKPAAGKRFPTAALAQLKLPDDWRRLEPRSARLNALIRPRDIKKS